MRGNVWWSFFTNCRSYIRQVSRSFPFNSVNSKKGVIFGVPYHDNEKEILHARADLDVIEFIFLSTRGVDLKSYPKPSYSIHHRHPNSPTQSQRARIKIAAVSFQVGGSPLSSVVNVQCSCKTLSIKTPADPSSLEPPDVDNSNWWLFEWEKSERRQQGAWGEQLWGVKSWWTPTKLMTGQKEWGTNSKDRWWLRANPRKNSTYLNQQNIARMPKINDYTFYVLEISRFLWWTLSFDAVQRRLNFCFLHQPGQKLRSEQVFTSLKTLKVVQKITEALVGLGKNFESSSEEYFLEYDAQSLTAVWIALTSDL